MVSIMVANKTVDFNKYRKCLIRVSKVLMLLLTWLQQIKDSRIEKAE